MRKVLKFPHLSPPTEELLIKAKTAMLYRHSRQWSLFTEIKQQAVSNWLPAVFMERKA